MALPKKPKTIRGKLPAPDDLVKAVDAAKARALKRSHGPPLFIRSNDDGTTEWDCPFAIEREDHEGWVWLLLDAFGTRYATIAGVFLNHLQDLCHPGEWSRENDGEWIPDHGEAAMLVHVVGALRPKNEAQAALAAQMAACHLLTMRVAKRVADNPEDHRMVGSFARLAQASAAQFKTMASIQGKSRTTRQKITVSHEKHIHDHQHIHIDRGPTENEHQPHATMEGGAIEDRGSASLPSQDETGQGVPLPSGKRQTHVPNARRQGLRSAKGNGERGL
tara:strand:+ start:18693 stop:19523 length:831 start_codon:yes stop_codon:yes gene_type:complete